MNGEKQKDIVLDYQEFWTLAREISEKESFLYPLGRNEGKRDRLEKHLLGMLEMYQIRHGDPEERLRIVNFLEKQLFRDQPVEDEVCRLTIDMWKDLRHSILTGEYKDLTKEGVER